MIRRRAILATAGSAMGLVAGCSGDSDCDPPEAGANRDECDYSEEDFSGQDLSEASFVETDFTGADLSEADLSGADLTKANLTGANLVAADLTEAVLQDADLTDAVLEEATLVDADLRRAQLAGTNFELADLTGANLNQIYGAEDAWQMGPIDEVNPPNKPVRFAQATLVEASLQSAIMPNAYFRGANLTRINGHKASFLRSDLSDTVMRNANVTDSDFRGANVENANFYGSNFTASQYLSFGYCPDASCSGAAWDEEDE